MWSDLGAVSGELAGDSGNVVDLIERKYEVKMIVCTIKTFAFKILLHLSKQLLK